MPSPSSCSLRRLLALLVLATSSLGARAALASPEAPPTSIVAFERATAAARAPQSGNGSKVSRAELRNALSFFLHDDGTIDAGERGHLGACLADPAWRATVSDSALAYAIELHELVAESAPVSVTTAEVPGPLVDVLGAAGALTSSLWLQEGRVSGAGVLSHAALRAAYGRAYNASVGPFDPIDRRELSNELSGRLELGMPTKPELEGVLAYLGQGPRPAFRLYLAQWVATSRESNPGEELGGVVIAAVSADRKTVRFVELRVWSD